MLANLGARLGYAWGKLKYTIRNIPCIRAFRYARRYWDTMEETQERERQLDEEERNGL
jgi:hypothetical protein